MEKLYIVIPAYNEEENIEKIVCEWHEIVKRAGTESRIVVIDDGSKDHTYEKLCILKKNLPQLITLLKENGGHGAAVLYGYRYAIKAGADYIFQTDSDGQTLPCEFAEFWKMRHSADAVIGWRSRRKDGFSRVIVTKVLKIVIFLIFGINVPDANTPFRLMKTELLEKYIPLVPKKYNLSNVLLTVLFLENHESVIFMPITFLPRQGGVNSINIRKIVRIGIKSVLDFRRIKKTRICK